MKCKEQDGLTCAAGIGWAPERNSHPDQSPYQPYRVQTKVGMKEEYQCLAKIVPGLLDFRNLSFRSVLV